MNIRLGLGLVGIGREWGYRDSGIPSESDAMDLLQTAYELGISLFDTAPSYGLSEKRLGKFISNLNTHERKTIIITTKFGEHWDEKSNQPYVDHSYDALVRSFETSYSLLGKIDAVQIHKTTPEVLKSDDVMRALEYVKNSYSCSLGSSIKDIESGQITCHNDRFTFIQFPYNMHFQNLGEIVDLAVRSQKIILINRPINSGELLKSLNNEDEVRRKAEESYRFIMKKSFNGFILTGTKSIDHLKMNVQIFNQLKTECGENHCCGH